MAKERKRPAESWTFVLPSDLAAIAAAQTDEERATAIASQTTFRLRPLTQEQRATCLDDVNRTVVDADGGRIVKGRERQTKHALCVTNIVSIENFPPGAPVAWPRDRDERIAYLNRLDDDDVQEIGGEIFEHSAAGEPEKN